MAAHRRGYKGRSEGDLGEEMPYVRTVSICPHCGVKHHAYLQWGGRGIPRIFCPECRDRITRMNSEEYHVAA